jgi:hypothetical protein
MKIVISLLFSSIFLFSDQNITLKANMWNMVGTSQVPTSSDSFLMSDYLSSENIETIVYQLSTGALNKITPNDFNSYKQIYPNKAYWIKAKKDTTITFTGTQTRNISVDDLVIGWNFISFNTNDSMENAFNTLKSKGAVVETIVYQLSTGALNKITPNDFNEYKTVSIGKGYWVKVSEINEVGITPPPSTPSITDISDTPTAN